MHGTKKYIYLYKDNVKAHSASWVKLIEAVAALCKWDFFIILKIHKMFRTKSDLTIRAPFSKSSLASIDSINLYENHELTLR